MEFTNAAVDGRAAVQYRRASMRLATAHKILIAASITVGGVFCGWSLARFARTGDRGMAIAALASAAVALALTLYLRRFIRREAGK